jgi:hypothetical protein
MTSGNYDNEWGLATRSTLQLAADSKRQDFFFRTIRDFVRPFADGVRGTGR